MIRVFSPLAIAVLIVAPGGRQPVYAQNSPARQPPPRFEACWQNAANGNPVPRSDIGPFGSTLEDENHAGIHNPGTPNVPATNVTFVRGPDGSWSNSATGAPVPNSDLGPFGSTQEDENHAGIHNPGTPNVPATNVTFVRVPCPPPLTASMGGLPRIVDFPSAAQAGDAIRLRVAGADPADASLWLDNHRLDATVVSSGLATLTVPVGFSLGAHQLVLRSHDQESAVTIHIVNLFADPLATTEPGVVQTVTVHVEGLTDADAGTMYFKTADPAQFVSGNAIDSAPVVGGIATTQIVGVHVGPAVIQFKLVVTPKPTK